MHETSNAQNCKSVHAYLMPQQFGRYYYFVPSLFNLGSEGSGMCVKLQGREFLVIVVVLA